MNILWYESFLPTFASRNNSDDASRFPVKFPQHNSFGGHCVCCHSYEDNSLIRVEIVISDEIEDYFRELYGD